MCAQSVKCSKIEFRQRARCSFLTYFYWRGFGRQSPFLLVFIELNMEKEAFFQAFFHFFNFPLWEKKENIGRQPKVVSSYPFPSIPFLHFPFPSVVIVTTDPTDVACLCFFRTVHVLKVGKKERKVNVIVRHQLGCELVDVIMKLNSLYSLQGILFHCGHLDPDILAGKAQL